jgi:hypothetical protein
MPVRANTHACPWARALRARVCCICVRGPCLGRPVSALGHPFGHLAPAGPLTPPAACWLLSVRDELFECQAVNSQLRVSLAVSRPFSSWNRSILTEIYLCHACSCQEILRTKTAGQDADFKTIKKAFRKLSRTLHPDKAPDGKGDQARFALVAGAYETLSDPDKRSMYDAFGSVTRFQVPGMQRTYIAAKGIQLKVYEDEDAAVKAWTKRQFMKRNTEDTYIVDFFAPVRSLARDELTEVFPTA